MKNERGEERGVAREAAEEKSPDEGERRKKKSDLCFPSRCGDMINRFLLI